MRFLQPNNCLPQTFLLLGRIEALWLSQPAVQTADLFPDGKPEGEAKIINSEKGTTLSSGSLSATVHPLIFGP